MGGASLEATTALSSDILQNKTAYDGEGNLLTGSIINRGSLTKSLSPGTSTSFDAGYYSGGTISIGSAHNIGTITISMPWHTTGNSSTTVNVGHTILGMATGDIVHLNWAYPNFYSHFYINVTYSGSIITATCRIGDYSVGQGHNLSFTVAYLY